MSGNLIAEGLGMRLGPRYAPAEAEKLKKHRETPFPAFPMGWTALGFVKTVGGIAKTAHGVGRTVDGLIYTMGGTRLTMHGLSYPVGGTKQAVDGLSQTVHGADQTVRGLGRTMHGLNQTVDGLIYPWTERTRPWAGRTDP